MIGGAAFFLFALAVFTLVYISVRSGRSADAGGGWGDKIAVIDIEGVILSPKDTVK